VGGTRKAGDRVDKTKGREEGTSIKKKRSEGNQPSQKVVFPEVRKKGAKKRKKRSKPAF